MCISAVAYSRLMFSGVPVNSTANVPYAAVFSATGHPPRPSGVGQSRNAIHCAEPTEAPRPVSGEALSPVQRQMETKLNHEGKGVPWKILAGAGNIGWAMCSGFFCDHPAGQAPSPSKS